MKDLNFLLSLTTKDNDYQQDQAADAEKTARRLGVNLQVIYAENDSITQSQQLLEVILSRSGVRPDGILFEPVGSTGLPQVARAAVSAGIGWGILNLDAEYLAELRKTSRAPIFAVGSDHYEIGRIQGRQIAALLPNGGHVLYLQGPPDSDAAKQRTTGMNETKPANIQIKLLKAHWTEETAYRAVNSWLRLSTSRQERIDLLAAQDDAMAIGARKAFEELSREHPDWANIPITGCDGGPATGQAWVNQGVLKATVLVPPNAGTATEILCQALRKGVPASERTLTTPTPYPPIEAMSRIRALAGS